MGEGKNARHRSKFRDPRVTKIGELLARRRTEIWNSSNIGDARVFSRTISPECQSAEYA